MLTRFRTAVMNRVRGRSLDILQIVGMASLYTGLFITLGVGLGFIISGALTVASAALLERFGGY